MYLKSREDLESFAKTYADNPAHRQGIRLSLHQNAADILLVIYWEQGRAETVTVIERVLGRNGGRPQLTAAIHELLAFSHFDDWDVRVACENTAYLIAVALDRIWDEE